MGGLALEAGICSGTKATVTATVATAAAMATLAVLTMAPLAWAGKAHEHGVARVDIGVETGRITLDLELPLEDLAGFERAPRTDAERATVAAVLARLREADKLVRIDGAARCGPGKVELTALPWGVDAAAPAANAPANVANKAASGAATGATSGAASGATSTASSVHGDLAARYQFLCPATDGARHLELGLFDAFARLRRIEVQVVTPRGQIKVVLRRPQGRVSLAR